MCLLTILVACGRRAEENSEPQRQERETPQETEGMYQAKIIPVNIVSAGSTVGVFRIRIMGDEVRVRGDINNSTVVSHQQKIHRGQNCPGPGADDNLDGVVSYDESLKITGGVLFPLTSATPDHWGNYLYSARFSLTDILTKLPPDEDLNMSGRVIMIYGGNGSLNFPIACGVLERVD